MRKVTFDISLGNIPNLFTSEFKEILIIVKIGLNRLRTVFSRYHLPSQIRKGGSFSSQSRINPNRIILEKDKEFFLYIIRMREKPAFSFGIPPISPYALNLFDIDGIIRDKNCNFVLLPDGYFDLALFHPKVLLLLSFRLLCFVIPFLLAVDAAAILLAVEAKLLGDPQPLLPSLSPVLKEEGDPILAGQLFANRAHGLKFLMVALQKGGGEVVKPTLFGHLGRLGEPHRITELTPVRLPIDNPAEETHQIIVILIDHPQSPPF